jgi:hypothetical protein
MKRTINLCTQGDVQNPCPMRQVFPVYSEESGCEYLKVCTSKLSQACSKSPHDIDLKTRYAFCGPVLPEVIEHSPVHSFPGKGPDSVGDAFGRAMGRM